MTYSNDDIYQRWLLMINRCGNQNCYEDVVVCEEWQDYQNFKTWFQDHEYGTKQWRLEIDKDLFGKGSKIYSPETCCLIPKSVNILIASCTSRNGLLPGVSFTKNNTYKGTVKFAGKAKSRIFKTELEAFQYYKEEKEKVIKNYTEAYRFLLPEYIYKALMEYEVKEERHICKHPENLKKDFYVQVL